MLGSSRSIDDHRQLSWWPRRSVLASILAVVIGSSWSVPAAGADAKSGDLAERVDIGGGRHMYLECQGVGSPLVLLISGMDESAELWHGPDQPEPTVYSEVAKATRVCAFDRPGTPTSDGPSRSDPVPMPVTTRDGADDLEALIAAADIPRPFVIAGHSYGGLITRLYAREHPDDVSGLVLIDILTPELQDEMTAEEWEIWKVANARREEDIALYPDLERADFQESVDVVRDAPPLEPMPLIVLTADELFEDVVRDGVRAGFFPPSIPEDFGAVVDRSHRAAQITVAAAVPGSRHITETNAGHNIMVDQPVLVTDAILDVVAAVREGRSTID